MTTSLMLAMAALYLVAFAGIAYFARARMLRITGALFGGSCYGLIAVGAVALGENHGWWSVPKAGAPHFVLLLWLVAGLSCAPVYLITWRTVRRFGGRGLVLFTLAAAVIGPSRDYQVAAMFPMWITFAPGVTPILAAAANYAILVLLGHGIMRMISGPARGDSFARLSRRAAKENPV